MGSEAALWAPHTWLEGLPDLNLTPERVVFLAQGSACIPLTPEQWRKVRGLFLSVETVPSGAPNRPSVQMLLFQK